MTYITQINDLQQTCSRCTDTILPDGSSFCGECAIGNSLRHHRALQRAENEAPEYTVLLKVVSSTHNIPTAKLEKIVQVCRKFYRIGSRKETSLSALKRIVEALEREEYPR